MFVATAFLWLFAFVLPSATLTAQPLASAKVSFSIDPRYEAAVENFYTTQFPSRWTNQVSGTAWRTSHDAAANWLRQEWSHLLEPFAAEGAFAELRPFNFVDPNGGDNQDPFGLVGPETNVLAFMPGSDPVLRNQVVIIGGHYDCVDVVVDGGLDCGMQMPVATAVLEGLVRYWKANSVRPKRSFALFAIDGEEQCLCGSVHYTTVDSPNALFHHLQLPPQLSVVAYHDTDMIGANYPNRMFGLSSNDFMPLNVFSAPAVENPQRVAGPFASYYGAIANPAFLARFKLYRAAILRQRDRFFTDMHAKYPSWTYRDGVTKPLFTDAQKKYVNIVDDPLDRSDHTVFIANGIPADINIGLSDPSAAPPGWPSYHHPGETQEEVEYFRSGRMTLNADTLLGYEATAAWIAYESGAGEDSPVTEPFFIGETAPGGLPPIDGVAVGLQTRDLPAMPTTQLPGTWRPLGTGDVIVRALAIDPTNSRRLYAATQSNGLLVSGDGGKTFTKSNAGLGAFTSLWSVATDPATKSRLYASAQHGAVFRSDDGGKTWRPTVSAAKATAGDVTFTEPTQPFVSSTDMLQDNIAVDQTHSETGGTWLYGINQCLHQFAPSSQDCSTRADWPDGGFDLYDTLLEYYRYASDAAVMGNGTVVASGFSTYITPGGTFRSTDGGSTWTYTWRTSSGGSPGDSNL
ncbi:MAG: M28 family peptidase, partial [Actinomycetota bacterium]|nr:M28 family peptidase [Actinomycetota bacterium]